MSASITKWEDPWMCHNSQYPTHIGYHMSGSVLIGYTKLNEPYTKCGQIYTDISANLYPDIYPEMYMNNMFKLVWFGDGVN